MSFMSVKLLESALKSPLSVAEPLDTYLRFYPSFSYLSGADQYFLSFNQDFNGRGPQDPGADLRAIPGA